MLSEQVGYSNVLLKDVLTAYLASAEIEQMVSAGAELLRSSKSLHLWRVSNKYCQLWI